MGRNKRDTTEDISNYTVLETLHWSDISGNSGKYDAGKANIKPCLEMLGKTGYEQTYYDHEKKTIQAIKYDDKYVFEHYFQKLTVTMGWMQSGQLDESPLQAFLDAFFSYCRDAGERAKEILIMTRAKELAEQFPTATAEEWEETLRDKAAQRKATETNGSAAKKEKSVVPVGK